ncbi:DUF1800 domain-containing protein [Usitatibacter palustris]|uniref:DUF1800 domain-containing protein n=1 Tax=Usitatibacter palustris TaxID=2732487 RepID=A0A6M4H5Q6_9PROT|nr:DUF1800 domain-containing protein [Usitatibacter palustris]QJR14999.1 hypothetical protein DSM104440_01814 [Usitatibacter palustris]
MRAVLALLLLFLSLAGNAQGQAIGYDGARHLLNRTGFGATEAEVRDYAKLSRLQAVDRLLADTPRVAAGKPPAFVDEPPMPFYKYRQLDDEAKKAELRRVVERGLILREWWFREMLTSASPLTERMTLFWHNHFATSQQKVRSPQLMYRQNVLLRREALGNFGTLLHAVARDPAMLIYLDNAGSRRQAPNENFAREVMELFTVGEGHYGEKDIKEAARAFTGWSLDRDSLEFTNRALWHDGGVKTVLGKQGRFDGDDVLDILLARPETGTFIVGKLWKEFVSPTPDPREVERLAAAWREARYEVKPLMRAMLVSDAFWSAEARGAIVKSPVDLVVGTMKTFEIRPATLRPAVLAAALLGQNPMSPPNVKGWPGGEAWINSATLLGRKQLLERLFRGSDAMAMTMVAAEVPAPMEGQNPEARFRRLMERGMRTYAFDWERWSKTLPPANVERLVLAMPAVNPMPEGTEGVELVRHLTADPAYQLK